MPAPRMQKRKMADNPREELMSIPNGLAPQLPYLRRFARALSGGQADGDACVVAMLRTLTANPSMLPADLHPKAAKVEIFRTFLNLWNSGQLNPPLEQGSAFDPCAAADAKLAAVTPRARQAYILRAIEDFTAGDAARILETDEEDAKALVDEAAAQIAEQLATNVLIIEDEPMIAIDLKRLVTGLGHEVCATARTHKAAVAAFHEHYPGLVLADIQLADGSSGLAAVDEILQSFDVPVIFITAFPERFLTGRRSEPTFLINKPFRTQSVQAAISQALFFDHKAYSPVAQNRPGVPHRP